jgi:hypothetical protein
MKVSVRNLTSTAEIVLGLPGGGVCLANVVTEFTTSHYFFYGADGKQPSPAARLEKLAADGKVTVDLEPTKGDLFNIGQKHLRLAFADADFSDADTSQTWDSDDTFPTGARYLGHRTTVTALLTSSGAMSSALLDVGLDDAASLFLNDLNVRTASGTTGEKRTTRRFASTGDNSPDAQPYDTDVQELQGEILGGKKIRAILTMVGANVSTVTAGIISIKVLYIIAP